MKLSEEVDEDKLRGGFYTPEPVAKFILRWATNGSKDYDILEPSCGDGVFLKQIKEQEVEYENITGVEIIDEEAEKARKIELSDAEILNKDFLNYCSLTGDRYDLVVGNPPYIRYQYMPNEAHEKAEKLFERAGLDYSRLSNMWLSFVVGSTLLLNDHGKLGMVIPAGLLQTSNTEPIRDFLSERFNKISLITFEELIFQGIDQEVVLLLAEKNGNERLQIQHLEVGDENKLKDLNVSELKSPQKEINPKSDKWTFFFLDQNEINLIEKYQNNGMDQIGTYADVQVGMTTGYNKFFTVTKSTVEEYNLHEYAEKMVGRAVQVPSLVFTEEDWKENTKKDKRAYFLKFPPKDELENGALEYVNWGEEQEFHNGYKTGKRDEWQVVPSTWVSDALFIRRNNVYPKLIMNDAEAYTTDTMHRVKLDDDVNERALIASYYNSLSLAFAEISGRSHGGGALELMPNEAEEIRIPYDERNADLLDEIDKVLREDKNIDEIIEYTDEIILKERAGLSESDIETANRAWEKLRDRRLNRN
jgi:adenine-specific DNA methylase